MKKYILVSILLIALIIVPASYVNAGIGSSVGHGINTFLTHLSALQTRLLRYVGLSPAALTNNTTTGTVACNIECQNDNPGGYFGYDFEHSKGTKIESIFNWQITPKDNYVGLYEMTHGIGFEIGQGGYTGPQIEIQNGQVVKKVIFSIWNSFSDHATAHPYSDWCSAGPADPSQGEFAVQCMLASNKTNPNQNFTWRDGVDYKILIERDEILSDGVVWKGTIKDMSTGQVTLIGKIKLDDQPPYKGQGLLAGHNGGFAEYYLGNNNRCLDAEYNKIIRKGPYLDGKWLAKRATFQNSFCITSKRYSPKPGVIVEEMGYGVNNPANPLQPARFVDQILWDLPNDLDISENPSIAVISPDGGVYGIGDTINIQWQLIGIPLASDELRIKIKNLSGGTVDANIPAILAASNSSYNYVVPAKLTVGSKYKVAIEGTINGLNISAISSNYFSIGSPSVSVVYPNGGEKLSMEKAYKIFWRSVGYANGYHAVVYLVNNNTGKKIEIGNSEAAIGNLDWMVPKTISDQNFNYGEGNFYKIKVDIVDGGQRVVKSDVSNATFSIVPQPPVTVYRDIYYSGGSQAYDLGSYTLSQMMAKGTLNDDISSVKIAPGYKVIFYEDDNFRGAAIIDIADDPNFVDDGWNDRVSSMVIEPSIVVDNTFATLVGAWTTSTFHPGYYGTNYIGDGNTGKGTKTATFKPTLPVAGNYKVFARWTAASNRATNVPIVINSTSGPTTVVVNQRLNNNVWFSLGTYNLNSTGASVVIKTTGTNGHVIADAIGFAAIDPLPPPRCDIITQRCVIGGTGPDCLSDADCSYHGTCGNGTCDECGGGAICTTNSECNLPTKCAVDPCTGDDKCVSGGSGPACSTNADCQQNRSTCGNGTCDVCGGGAYCTSNIDCTSLPTRCGTDPCTGEAKCVSGGTGPLCSVNADCLLSPRCGADPYGNAKCVLGGTGPLCISNLDCAPPPALHCNITTQTCTTGGTGPLCKTNADCLPEATTVIVDDTSATLVGAWTSSKFNSGYYGAGYIHDGNINKGAKTAAFNPVLSRAGSYEVYMIWSTASNRATNIPVDIIHASGTDTVIVNGNINGGKWNLLGTYTFNTAGGSVLIRTTGTNNYVVADAVKFVPVGTNPPPSNVTTFGDTIDGGNVFLFLAGIAEAFSGIFSR